MGGVVNTVKSVATNVVKDPISGIARIGADVITLGANEAVGNPAGKLIGAFTGYGRDQYTPQTLSAQDPKLLLAQTGGAPLLTQIAMGVKVDDALAGYFGKASGDDFKQYYKSLPAADQSAIDSVKNQLTQVQSNTDLRNQAVQKLIDDFPNIAAQTLDKQRSAYNDAITRGKTEALDAFDESTKAIMDRSASQLSARFAASGGFSSGAFNQGLARSAADLAIQRGQIGAQYAGLRTQTGLDLANQDAQNQFTASNLRFSETEALRNFQQKMLGQGVNQGFSAAQNQLGREQQLGMFNANQKTQADMYNQQQRGQMFGALGQLGGTIVGAYFGGPLGASIGGQMGSMVGGSMGGGMQGGAPPRLSLYNQGQSGYQRYAGGY